MPIQRHHTTPPPTAEHIINKVAERHDWTTTRAPRTTSNEPTRHHKDNTWIAVQYTDNANRAVQNAWRTNYDTGNTDILTGRDKGKRETILDWLMGLA